MYQQYSKQYLLEHVLSDAKLQSHYVLPGPGIEWDKVAGQEWMDCIDKLIQSLCVLGFLYSGPGLRGEEWAPMLAMSEQNGSCSVFWTMKGLCFMTGYSKVIQALLHAHWLISL